MASIFDNYPTGNLPKKRLTLTPELVKQQEETYIQAKVDGKTGREAAKMAGYSGTHLRKPQKLIETPELRARMQAAMRRSKVGLDAIADTVANGLKANVLHVTKDGVDETQFADHGERRKSAELAARLWGITDRPNVDAGGGSTITLTLAGPLAERIAARMSGVEEK